MEVENFEGAKIAFFPKKTLRSRTSERRVWVPLEWLQTPNLHGAH